MKRALSSLVGLWPSSKLKNRALNMLGHKISMSASIAPILIAGHTKLQVEDFARVGPLNAFRSVPRVFLGRNSEIGQLNWVSAAPFLIDTNASSAAGSFHLGEHSSFTSRHYVDASGGVAIGDFVTVAGVRSVFMSHGIDVADNVLDIAPIIVGDYAMVGGGCNLVMGAVVPAYSVVAMGSVVIKGLERTHALYAGAPAKFKKVVAAGAYASRRHGAVPPRNSSTNVVQ